MPRDLYVDGISVKALSKKKKQTNQTQPTQTYSDDVDVDEILREKRAQLAYLQTQKKKSKSPYEGYEKYYEGKKAERRALGLAYQTKEAEMFKKGEKAQTTIAIVGTGTQLNPDIEPSLPTPKERNLFLESWFESSPWGIFTPEKAPKVSEYPEHKYAILAGKALGEAGDIAAWMLGGYGVGRAITTSTKATKIVAKLGGKSKATQAVRGILKGAFVGGEAGKAYVLHEQGYTPEEIAIDIGADIGSFFAFEQGLKTAVEPKINEMKIIEEVESRHIIYGEKGESVGVGLKGTGEKGWKPTVYSTKTKSISASAIDKQRGLLYEEGVDIAGGKGRFSWIGRIKKFITAAEFKMTGYNPEKPFIVKELPVETVMGGGRSIQMSREITPALTELRMASSVSGSARSALINAIKSVEWVSIPTTGIGGITTIPELIERKKKVRRPSHVLIPEERIWKELKPEVVVKQQTQEEIIDKTYTPIMTYKQDLEQQVWKELESEVTIKQEEEEEIKPDIIVKTKTKTMQKIEPEYMPRIPQPPPPIQETIEETALTASEPIPPGTLPPRIAPPTEIGVPAPMPIMEKARSSFLPKADVLGKWERELKWGEIELGVEKLFKKPSKKSKKNKRSKRKKSRKGRKKSRKKRASKKTRLKKFEEMIL